MQAKTKKILITSVIAGSVAIILIAMFIRSKRKKLQALINAGSTDVVQPAKSTVSATSVVFPLKKGSGKTSAEKNAVRVVQRYINAKSIFNPWLQVGTIDEDGIFGSITENALNTLSGTNQVSYSFYLEMQNFLKPATIATQQVQEQKNNYSLSDINPLTLFM